MAFSANWMIACKFHWSTFTCSRQFPIEVSPGINGVKKGVVSIAWAFGRPSQSIGGYMILEIVSHAGQMVYYGNTQLGQLRLITDPRQE